MELLSKQWVQFKGWLFRDQHKQRAHDLSMQVNKAFTEHPAQAGETYWAHLWFTLKMTARLIFGSVALFIHGVFPFLFVRTTSAQVEKIWMIMRSRIPEQRREEIKQTWHI